MDKLIDFDDSVDYQEIGKQDEIFETIGNDKIDKFFENYKQFDKFLKIKDKNALIYSGHVWLGGEESGKLHSDFYEAFRNSIKGIVGEETFERMRIFFDNKDYLLSTDMKRYDGDPFLDDKFQTIVLGNNTVAQFIERRNESNDIEFHYTVYPEHIFKFIEKLLKR